MGNGQSPTSMDAACEKSTAGTKGCWECQAETGLELLPVVQSPDNNTLHTETSEASSQVSVRVMNILFEKIADSLSTVIG